MNNDISTYARQPHESEAKWKSRVKRHIIKHTPESHRYYIRGGKPGVKGQRWILPVAFVLIGCFFSVSSYVAGLDIRALNGPNGRQGKFIVTDSRSRDTRLAKGTYNAPVVVIRETPIIPLFSKGLQFEVGQPVTLRYTQ